MSYAPRNQPPRHEQWKLLGFAREGIRRRFYGLLRKALVTDDGRQVVSDALSGLLDWHPGPLFEGIDAPAPYPELRAWGATRPPARPDVVFITGRFRSGSTLLWNLFRNIEGVTSYYEPLNERRWFDPKARGSHVDGTHRNVSDYWREYEGMEGLGAVYREDWIRRNLLMWEGSWDPVLERYVDMMIKHAPGRPVLQFNRIDFRLPWFRHHYPEATFLHIYRHPRDQWCSTLQEDLHRFPKDGTMADFGMFDRFYLRMWASDLKYHFPFLDERTVGHPYQLFYYLWKLSFLFGVKYCDYSIQFERLVEQPDREVPALLEHVGMVDHDMEALRALIGRPSLGKWRNYAEGPWYEDHERACERALAEFLRVPRSGIEARVDTVDV